MNSQFQDITQFLKSGLSFQDLYKLKRTSTFGKTLLTDRTAQRAENLNKRRKELRGDILLKNRGIKDMDVSTSTAKNNITVQQIKMEERLERLRKWKEMRDKKKTQLKVHQKPLFKVCHVSPSVGLPSLENINKTIKGKVIALERTKLGISKLVKTEINNSKNIKEKNFDSNVSKLENRSLTKANHQLRVKPSVQIKLSDKSTTKTKQDSRMESERKPNQKK